MKLMNLRRFDPEYEGVGLTRGGSGDQRVWDEFVGDPERCALVASAIRASAASHEPSVSITDPGPVYEVEAQEGRGLTRQHQVRERNQRLVQRRKEQFRKLHGRLFCEVCGFDFAEVYGKRGEGFIECHHTRPLHSLKPGDKTRLADLALLCSNCHRMIHASRPWLSLAEPRALLG